MASAFITSFVNAALPGMEAPSRGEETNIIQTMQNYAFEGAALIGLLILATAYCGVAYHAYGTFAEVQSGKKTWGSSGSLALLVLCF